VTIVAAELAGCQNLHLVKVLLHNNDVFPLLHAENALCCEYQMLFIIYDTNTITSELSLLRKICEHFWHILKTWEGDGRDDHRGDTCKQTWRHQ